jgi:hypothetical protein
MNTRLRRRGRTCSGSSAFASRGRRLQQPRVERTHRRHSVRRSNGSHAVRSPEAGARSTLAALRPGGEPRRGPSCSGDGRRRPETPSVDGTSRPHRRKLRRNGRGMAYKRVTAPKRSSRRDVRAHTEAVAGAGGSRTNRRMGRIGRIGRIGRTVLPIRPVRLISSYPSIGPSRRTIPHEHILAPVEVKGEQEPGAEASPGGDRRTRSWQRRAVRVVAAPHLR